MESETQESNPVVKLFGWNRKARRHPPQTSKVVPWAVQRAIKAKIAKRRARRKTAEAQRMR